MLWICLAIALVPVAMLIGVCGGLWGRTRRLFREVRGLSWPTSLGRP